MLLSAAMRVLTRKIKAKLPVLLVGAPGIGKTDLAKQLARDTKHHLLVSHPVVCDPTDAKGLPAIGPDGIARFLPYGVLALVMAATEPTLWLLDDLGQASPAVQAAFMQLLLARHIDGVAIPDCVTIIAATNRKGDRAGVSGLLEPVKSRFVTIIEIQADLPSWTNWAFQEGLPPELIAFLQFNPELFHVHNPTTELVNSPAPRTWHNAAKIMQAGLDEDIAVASEELAGAIGSAAATQFMKFMTVAHDMPSLEDILMGPETARVPTELSTLWLLTSGLASHVTKKNFKAISTYALRINEADKGDLAAYLIRKCVTRNPELTQTAAYSGLLVNEAFAPVLQAA